MDVRYVYQTRWAHLPTRQLTAHLKTSIKIRLYRPKVNMRKMKHTLCGCNIRMCCNQYSMCDHQMTMCDLQVTMCDLHLTLCHNQSVLHDLPLTLCHNSLTLCHHTIVLRDLHLTLCHNQSVLRGPHVILCHNQSVLHDFPVHLYDPTSFLFDRQCFMQLFSGWFFRWCCAVRHKRSVEKGYACDLPSRTGRNPTTWHIFYRPIIPDGIWNFTMWLVFYRPNIPDGIWNLITLHISIDQSSLAGYETSSRCTFLSTDHPWRDKETISVNCIFYWPIIPDGIKPI